MAPVLALALNLALGLDQALTMTIEMSPTNAMALALTVDSSSFPYLLAREPTLEASALVISDKYIISFKER